MNGHIDLTAIVLLALGGVAVYAAYKNPQLGAAIMVGIGVVTVLYLLLYGSGHSTTTPFQAPTAPPTAGTTATPTEATPSR